MHQLRSRKVAKKGAAVETEETRSFSTIHSASPAAPGPPLPPFSSTIHSASPAAPGPSLPPLSTTHSAPPAAPGPSLPPLSTTHSAPPAAPGPSLPPFNSIASESSYALNQVLPYLAIKPDPFTLTPDAFAMGSIPPYNGEASRSLTGETSLPIGSDIKIKGEQVSQEPSTEIVKAPPKQVRTVELVALFKDASLDDLEQGVNKGTEIIERLQQAVAPDPTTVQGDLKMWYQQLGNLKTQGSYHKTIIGVVGNTGAGKSSVINALLDEERLVPTNVCVYPC